MSGCPPCRRIRWQKSSRLCAPSNCSGVRHLGNVNCSVFAFQKCSPDANTVAVVDGAICQVSNRYCVPGGKSCRRFFFGDCIDFRIYIRFPLCLRVGNDGVLAHSLCCWTETEMRIRLHCLLGQFPSFAQRSAVADLQENFDFISKIKTRAHQNSSSSLGCGKLSRLGLQCNNSIRICFLKTRSYCSLTQSSTAAVHI